MAEIPKRKTKNVRRTELLAARLARLRVPLGFACAVAVLYLASPTPQSLAIGGAIALAGEMLRIWAAGHLDKGREVTQSGPYRFTRHPLYLGSALVACGAAIAAARVSVALILVGYVATTIVAAMRHEEANMRAKFGDRYDAYLQSRMAEPVERAFSLERAWSINKESHAVLGWVCIALILAAKVALKAD